MAGPGYGGMRNMNAEWKNFLEGNGAEFDGTERVVSFGNLRRELGAALNGNVFADLSHQGVLAVRGKDALEFLQGQFTNDLRHLGDGTSQLNGYCSAKGRLLASFRVIPEDDGFLLRMPRAMVEPLMKKLRMFVLRAAVTLEDVGECQIRLGVSGPAAERELGARVPALPQAVDGITRGGGYTVIRIPGVHPRFEVHGGLEAMRRLWDTLNVRCAPVGEAPWGLLDVLAGIPTIHPETSDAFVPQMVNLQLLGGVSFKKGCYPGQEVVARMQYLGTLKRRMYLARVLSEARPRPGDELYGPEDGEQSAGKVVDAQPHPDGGFMLLAVIQIASREAGDIRYGGPQGPKLEFAELPYPLPPVE